MRIRSFKIENYKNIKLAEGDNLPNFIVMSGSNGCGKSSILESLMLSKEMLGGYGYFERNPNCVSADADKSLISISFDFTQNEIDFVKERNPNQAIERLFTAKIQILKNGDTSVIERSPGNINYLFSRYSENRSFFDYFSPDRLNKRISLNTWSANFLAEDNIRQILSQGSNKGDVIKQYLASLKMKDLQNIQKAQRDKTEYKHDSLTKIREFFNSFFAPMKFDDVYLDENPFKFFIDTPRGKIDIDELSSGEKEILITFIHFHHLNPINSIILFDEPDNHLHPELERKYLRTLKSIGDNNQLILTTHSPEMMIEAGYSSLYTVIKYQDGMDGNQFRQISNSEELHNTLSILMGSKGFVSLNKKIVFIEGKDSSLDVMLFEKFFPNEKYNLTFIPTGGSEIILGTAEKINKVLTQGIQFQKYYSILDGDLERNQERIDNLELTYKLPVYHIENYLIDLDIIFDCIGIVLTNNPYGTIEQVDNELKTLLFDDAHILPFTKALLDLRISELTKRATDLIFRKEFEELKNLKKIEFSEIKTDAYKILNDAITDNTWRNICKGRDLLKSFCKKNNINYEHFRNLLLHNTRKVPESLEYIINKIIAD